MKPLLVVILLLISGCLATPEKKSTPLEEIPAPPAAANAAKIKRANCEGLMTAYMSEVAQQLAEECYVGFRPVLCSKADRVCRDELVGYCRTALRIMLVQEIDKCMQAKPVWVESPKKDPFPSTI